MITCSAFGTQAAPLYEKAKELAASDPDRLVRVRAAEFLGLTGAADPRPALIDVLNNTTDPIEANLTLNTVVLLRDGKPAIDFDFSTVEAAPWTKSNIVVQRRVEYLRLK